MSCTCSDTAEVSFTLGDSVDNLWKIKVSQISCDDDNVSNQEGCFQYFTGETGTISSYGLQSDVMLACQNYAICIRPEAGMCCIEYTATTWELARGNYDNYNLANVLVAAITGNCVALAASNNEPHCAGAYNCYVNYVIIPEVLSDVSVGLIDGTYYYTAPNVFDRFCGSKLTPQGWVTLATDPHVPVISCEKPFRIMHVTGVCATSATATALSSDSATGNAAGSAGVGLLTPGTTTSIPKGFELTYRQLPGQC